MKVCPRRKRTFCSKRVKRIELSKETLKMVKRIFYSFSILMALLLLAACLGSISSLKSTSVLSILSLLTPFLIVLNAFIVICLLWLKQIRQGFLVIILLVICYVVFGPFYVFNWSNFETNTEGLTIMSYNALGFNKNRWIKQDGVGDRIISFIKEQDPDVVCIQEHSKIRTKQLTEYPYRSETPDSMPKSVQAIFSKYPIINHESLDLPETVNDIIYADIVYNKDTVRIYNIHLQSFRIVPSTETFADSEQSEKNFRRLINTFQRQLDQANLFESHLKSSPYPNVVCGDFNNTQFSNVYRIVTGEMSDTFLEKGAGLGRTYNLMGFPIRIDYILADSEFEVLSHQNFDVKLSDHFPIMANLRLESK